MKMSEPLDVTKVSSILDITGKDNIQIKECEEKFEQYKSLPKFGPLLLIIACNKEDKFNENISLNASIQLKNYINSNWKYGHNEEQNKYLCFDNDKIIVISDEDKNFIRNNILEGMVYVVEKENVKVLKQFCQCVKKIIKLDYLNIWNKIYDEFLIKCLNTQNQKVIYAGILLLYQLSKLFQFEDAEKQKIYNEILIKINEKLLFFIDQCKQIQNNVEAMVIYKLVKIFFKSFQGEIPELLKREDVFSQWSKYIILIIRTQINQDYVMDKKNIFWKLKRACFQCITRILQKYANLEIKEKDKSNFQKLLEATYIPEYLETFTIIYKNYNNNQNYIDDYGKSCIYSFYTFLLGKKQYKKDIVNLFLYNNDLIGEMIKDAFITKEDLEMWATDPKNYIAQKSQELNYFTTKRYRVSKLLKDLLCYREKKNYICYNKIFEIIINTMIKDMANLQEEENIIKTQLIKDPEDERYIMNPNNIPHCLLKEGIIYLLKDNAEIIGKNSDAETLIEKYIFPNMFSPCGLLREQSCHLIEKFSPFLLKNNELLEKIIRKLCDLMENDPQLAVKLYASLAIGSLFEKDVTIKLLKGNIQNVLKINLKLMEETDTEEIMDNLTQIVKNFTQESQQYIVQLSEYLIKYLEKILSKDEDEKEAMNNYSIESNIITTFCYFIEYFINDKNIYPNIEKYIDQLLQYCFKNIYEKLEDGLDIIEAILKYGDVIPDHVWKFFIPLVESVIGSKEEIIEFKKEFPNNIFTGHGYESILDITKIVSIFIAKDPNCFINKQDEKGEKYFAYVIKLIESIISISESKGSYTEIKYSLRLIITLFDCYRGKIDVLFEQLIKYILLKYKIQNMKPSLENYLQSLLSNCFIYDPLKSLQILQKNNCAIDVFIFWFKGIDKLKRMEDMKCNLIGICSLISIEQNKQDKSIIDNMKQILEKIYLLTEKINKKIKENENNNCGDDDNEYEDIGDEENEQENKKRGGVNNMDDIIKNILDGGQGYGEDDDLSYEEEDDDEKPLTNYEKQSPILFVKNTLNAISQRSPDIYKFIMEALGDKLNSLNQIFNNEEQRLAKKNK